MSSEIPKHLQGKQLTYIGSEYPLIKSSKCKPHKTLRIVKVLPKKLKDIVIMVEVVRKDLRGCNASGDKSVIVPLTTLKAYVPPQPRKAKSDVAKPEVQPATSGIKYDADKLEFNLLPKGVLQPILRVLSFGKKKYAADNWQRVGDSKERYYNALQRHITQWWEGEQADQETGENHLAHAACCIMFLLWFDNHSTGKS